MKTYAIQLSNLSQNRSPLIRGNHFATAHSLGEEYVGSLGVAPAQHQKAVLVAANCCLYGGKALPAPKTAGRNRRAVRRLEAHRL
jgi:hypothetical protein